MQNILSLPWLTLQKFIWYLKFIFILNLDTSVQVCTLQGYYFFYVLIEKEVNCHYWSNSVLIILLVWPS